MKKFIYKILSFVALLSLITLIINFICLDNRLLGEIDKFKEVPYNIQICNLGSSHGYNDYYYDNLDDKYVCFNFALPSQSLDYDYKILRYYKDHIDRDAIVFITISYMSFYGIEENLKEDFLSKNKRYYHFLPKEYIKDYDLKTYIFETKLPVLTQYENLPYALFGQRENSNLDVFRTASEIDVNEYAEDAYKRHIIEEKLDESGNRIVNESYISSLYSMIDLCRDIGAVPILITTPFLSEYTGKIKVRSPEFFEEYYKMIESVKNEKNVVYYDYGFDNRFCYDYSLFRDADHLNREGALKFVDILLEEINFAWNR